MKTSQFQEQQAYGMGTVDVLPSHASLLLLTKVLVLLMPLADQNQRSRELS